MLVDIGIDEERIRQFGVANWKSVFTAYGPDGEPNTLTIPFALFYFELSYFWSGLASKPSILIRYV